MSRSKKSFGFLLLILGSAMYSNAMADFNLNCRAGGYMELIHNERTNTVTVTFSHAVKGTRYRALRKGECSWIDRPLRGKEPHKFCQKNVSDVIVKINARSFSVTSNKAPYISKLKNEGSVQDTFQDIAEKVGNTLHNCLSYNQITRTIKWKNIAYSRNSLHHL